MPTKSGSGYPSTVLLALDWKLEPYGNISIEDNPTGILIYKPYQEQHYALIQAEILTDVVLFLPVFKVLLFIHNSGNSTLYSNVLYRQYSAEPTAFTVTRA